MLPELEILKKATQELVKEDDRLFEMTKNWDTALDVVSDPIMVADKNCIIKCVNQAMVDTFNKKEKADLVGKQCHKYACVESNGVECCSCFTKDRFFYDNTLRKWFDHQSKIIYDGKENPIGRICILKDITEHKRIEDSLRDKLSALNQPVYGSCDMGIEDIMDLEVLQELQITFSYICDIACAIISNDGEAITSPSNFNSFCRLVRSTEEGLKKCEESRNEQREEVLKVGKTVIGTCKHFPQLLRGAIPLRVCNNVVGVVFMGQVKYKEIPEKHMREYASEIGVGGDRLVKNYDDFTTMTHDKFETIVTFFETFCNYISLLATRNMQQYKEINKRMIVEKELVESQSRFKDIVSLLSDWIWETNRSGVYTYCSGNVENVLGYKPEEMIGKTPFDFIPINRTDTVYRRFNEKFSNKESIRESTSWCVAKGGKLVCVSTNGVPMFNDKGEYIGYRGADVLIPDKYAEDVCGKKIKFD